MTQLQKGYLWRGILSYASLLGLISFAFYVGVEFNQNKSDHNVISIVQEQQTETLQKEITRAKNADEKLQNNVHALDIGQRVLQEKIDSQSITLEKIERKL
jgi:preprotein translocase subunit SecF